MNYFQLFGLTAKFTIDSAKLSELYQTLQKTVHPDKFVTASEQEKRLAVQWATQVNQAYNTLKRPLLRAIYLLELKEIKVETNPHLAGTFLMEQVELRE